MWSRVCVSLCCTVVMCGRTFQKGSKCKGLAGGSFSEWSSQNVKKAILLYSRSLYCANLSSLKLDFERGGGTALGHRASHWCHVSCHFQDGRNLGEADRGGGMQARQGGFAAVLAVVSLSVTPGTWIWVQRDYLRPWWASRERRPLGWAGSTVFRAQCKTKTQNPLFKRDLKLQNKSQQSIKPGKGTPPTTGHRWRTHEEAGPADGGFWIGVCCCQLELNPTGQAGWDPLQGGPLEEGYPLTHHSPPQLGDVLERLHSLAFLACPVRVG